MPIVSLRESDPAGELRATPDQRTGTDDLVDLVGQLIGAFKKRQKGQVDKAYREAAHRELEAGKADLGYEYDSATGAAKTKITPRKQDIGPLINRWKTAQQFGVDPVTGEKIPEDQLLKPRFGYQGDIFSQILNNPGALAEAMGDEPAPGIAPQPSTKSVVPAANAAIEIPEEGSKFLSPRDHYNQLRAAGYTIAEARKLAGV